MILPFQRSFATDQITQICKKSQLRPSAKVPARRRPEPRHPGRADPGYTAEVVLADRAYDSNALGSLIAAIGAKVVIPSTRSRSEPIPHDPLIYRCRNRIERCFNKLKHFRRFATRYERRAATSSASSTSPLQSSGCDECRFSLAHLMPEAVTRAASDDRSNVRFQFALRRATRPRRLPQSTERYSRS